MFRVRLRTARACRPHVDLLINATAQATPANLSWLEEKGLLDEAPCATSLQRQLALGNLLNDPEDEDRRNVRFEVLSLPQVEWTCFHRGKLCVFI